MSSPWLRCTLNTGRHCCEVLLWNYIQVPSELCYTLAMMFLKSEGNYHSLATCFTALCIFHSSVHHQVDGNMCFGGTQSTLKSAFTVTAKYLWKWSSKHSADAWRALQIKKGFQTFISGTVHQVLKYNKYKIMLKKISVYVQILKPMQQQRLPLEHLILKHVPIVTWFVVMHRAVTLNWE